MCISHRDIHLIRGSCFKLQYICFLEERIWANWLLIFTRVRFKVSGILVNSFGSYRNKNKHNF